MTFYHTGGGFNPKWREKASPLNGQFDFAPDKFTITLNHQHTATCGNPCNRGVCLQESGCLFLVNTLLRRYRIRCSAGRAISRLPGDPKVDEKTPDCPRHTVPITRIQRFTPVFFCPLFRSRHRKFRQLSLISRQTGLTRNPGHPKTMSGNCGEDIKLLIRTQITASIICGKKKAMVG